MATSAVQGVFSIIRERPRSLRLAVAPKLIELSGLVLFGCALLAAFRVMVLNAHHELHPGIDFAICSMTATVGLGIIRIYRSQEPKPTELASSANVV